MSEASGAHGLSRGSSLSILSGPASTGSMTDIRGLGSIGGGASPLGGYLAALAAAGGTASAAGGQHINVEDMTDDELLKVTEELKSAGILAIIILGSNL